MDTLNCLSWWITKVEAKIRRTAKAALMIQRKSGGISQCRGLIENLETFLVKRTEEKSWRQGRQGDKPWRSSSVRTLSVSLWPTNSEMDKEISQSALPWAHFKIHFIPEKYWWMRKDISLDMATLAIKKTFQLLKGWKFFPSFHSSLYRWSTEISVCREGRFH